MVIHLPRTKDLKKKLAEAAAAGIAQALPEITGWKSPHDGIVVEINEANVLLHINAKHWTSEKYATRIYREPRTFRVEVSEVRSKNGGKSID